jgi:hypothetical protein
MPEIRMHLIRNCPVKIKPKKRRKKVGERIIGSLVTVATAIIGIAILAVLVSKNAQTPQVITSAGSAFTNAIKAAVSPVSGGGFAGGAPIDFNSGI